jgi:AAA15 family ATPase/GTPase
MKLERIKIKNFRCYNTETTFEIDNLTCIIGKNDIGKSTILEALDAFFNDNIDTADLSSNGDSNIIELRCYFSGITEKIILDTSIETSPTEEGILNINNELEIVRRYSVGATVSKSIFLNCYYPENPELSDLLSLKNDTLKIKAENLNIDLLDIPKKQNAPLRKAIRDHFGGNRVLKEIKVDGNLPTESNLKKIWSTLKSMLPIYTLFKVDKPLDDKDKDVQDPMKSAIEETLAVPEIRDLLEQIESKVKEKVSAVADKIIEKLKDIDVSLAEKLKSDFKKSPSWKSVFDLTLLNENDIPG